MRLAFDRKQPGRARRYGTSPLACSFQQGCIEVVCCPSLVSLVCWRTIQAETCSTNVSPSLACPARSSRADTPQCCLSCCAGQPHLSEMVPSGTGHTVQRLRSFSRSTGGECHSVHRTQPLEYLCTSHSYGASSLCQQLGANAQHHQKKVRIRPPRLQRPQHRQANRLRHLLKRSSRLVMQATHMVLTAQMSRLAHLMLFRFLTMLRLPDLHRLSVPAA